MVCLLFQSYVWTVQFILNVLDGVQVAALNYFSSSFTYIVSGIMLTSIFQAARAFMLSAGD